MANLPLRDHEFIAELIKRIPSANVNRFDYDIRPCGLVEIDLSFVVPQETLDKSLEVWYNNTKEQNANR